MGKFEKKNKSKQSAPNGRKKNKVCLWLSIVLIVALCIAAAWFLPNGGEMSGDETEQNVGIVVQRETVPTIEPELKEITMDLGQKLFVTGIGKYAGIYMEDGSDELVDNVLMLKLTNHGNKTVEYAEITIFTSSGDAKFSVSTLNPGATAILLEKKRMSYSEAEDYTDIQADFASFFQEPLDTCEDILKIQALNGAINITNTSDCAISGPIRIYYKNYADGIYYGGITYRITIDGGIKAGELRQIMANHFFQNGSAILHVVCEDA